MRMSVSSYNQMNNLAGMCFNANAIIDNLAYSLDYHYYNRIAAIVHHNMAHIMPVWADVVTDKMLELSARPVRKDINGYEKDYSDLKEIFRTLFETFMTMRKAVIELIESADMDGDDEVRIFGEDFLGPLSVFIKQSEEWMDASEKLDNNTLNIHINDYTHFISIED